MLVEVGRRGEVAVSSCRTEAQNPSDYCTVHLTSDDGVTWLQLPEFGVIVEQVIWDGVLLSAPSSVADSTNYLYYGFDGRKLVTVEDVPSSSDVYVLSDRLVIVSGRRDVKQHPYQ